MTGAVAYATYTSRIISAAEAVECILIAILENVYYAKLEPCRARRLGDVTVKRRRLISDLVSLDTASMWS